MAHTAAGPRPAGARQHSARTTRTLGELGASKMSNVHRALEELHAEHGDEMGDGLGDALSCSLEARRTAQHLEALAAQCDREHEALAKRLGLPNKELLTPVMIVVSFYMHERKRGNRRPVLSAAALRAAASTPAAKLQARLGITVPNHFSMFGALAEMAHVMGRDVADLHAALPPSSDEHAAAWEQISQHAARLFARASTLAGTLRSTVSDFRRSIYSAVGFLEEQGGLVGQSALYGGQMGAFALQQAAVVPVVTWGAKAGLQYLYRHMVSEPLGWTLGGAGWATKGVLRGVAEVGRLALGDTAGGAARALGKHALVAPVAWGFGALGCAGGAFASLAIYLSAPAVGMWVMSYVMSQLGKVLTDDRELLARLGAVQQQLAQATAQLEHEEKRFSRALRVLEGKNRDAVRQKVERARRKATPKAASPTESEWASAFLSEAANAHRKASPKAASPATVLKKAHRDRLSPASAASSKAAPKKAQKVEQARRKATPKAASPARAASPKAASPMTVLKKAHRDRLSPAKASPPTPTRTRGARPARAKATASWNSNADSDPDYINESSDKNSDKNYSYKSPVRSPVKSRSRKRSA